MDAFLDPSMLWRLIARYERDGTLPPSDLRSLIRVGRWWRNYFMRLGDRAQARRIKQRVERVVSACRQGRQRPRRVISADDGPQILEQGLW